MTMQVRSGPNNVVALQPLMSAWNMYIGATWQLALASSLFKMSSPIRTKSGHARHDTALIHGLSTTEVQKLSEACIEAKGRAYCKLRYGPRFGPLAGH